MLRVHLRDQREGAPLAGEMGEGFRTQWPVMGWAGYSRRCEARAVGSVREDRVHACSSSPCFQTSLTSCWLSQSFRQGRQPLPAGAERLTGQTSGASDTGLALRSSSPSGVAVVFVQIKIL